MIRPFINYRFTRWTKQDVGVDWEHMHEFLELRGARHIEEYLAVEKNYVDTAMMFINYFQKRSGSLRRSSGTSIAPRVRTREWFDKELKEQFSLFYPSFDEHMDKMEDLCNKHHSLLTHEDLVYLLESAYRDFSRFDCSFMYKFAYMEIYGGINSSAVTLHHSYPLQDIFSKKEHVHFSVAHHFTDERIEEVYGENPLVYSSSNIQL